jgi:hypothetical protein
MSFVYGETVFQELIHKYPTWEKLESYLESEEGGLLRILDKKDDLCIIRYDKSISSPRFDLPHYRWFRSVVWDMKFNCPVSVAPPKTSQSEFPYDTVDEAMKNGIICEELMDGFMINCFRRVGDSKVYITTRSKLDAAGHFYSSKSFRTLFTESYLQQLNEEMINEEVLVKYLKKNMMDPNPEMGERSISYSFLVRHKEHRVVSDISQNEVYLVQQTILFDKGYMSVEEHFKQYNNRPNMFSYFSSDMTNEVKQMMIKDWMKYMMGEKSWTFNGFVCKDGKGNRWRFRSDKYMSVKSLRGNLSSPVERFSQLYLQNLTSKYLEYYPEDVSIFTTCNQYLQFHLLVELYYEYYYVHCLKSKTIYQVKKEFHPHLYGIHGIYLTQLRPNYQKITLNDIQSYLLKLPWQRLASLLLS